MINPAEIAQERPLVVLFTWERHDLLKMVLPRAVNATKRIGGYLWVVDDASTDIRNKIMLQDYWDQGWIDQITWGKKGRFIDWVKGDIFVAWGGACARRSVVLRLLARAGAPLVIFSDADIVVSEDAYERLLMGALAIRKEKTEVSGFCGFRYNKTIFDGRFYTKEGMRFIFFHPFSMALSLVPLDIVRKVEKELPSRFIGRWSLNEYAMRASNLGLPSCYVLDVQSQHLGIGISGRTFTTEKETSVLAYEPDGSLQQVKGFNVDLFMKVAEQTCLQMYLFSIRDHVDIQPLQPVHPAFFQLKELCQCKS